MNTTKTSATPRKKYARDDWDPVPLTSKQLIAKRRLRSKGITADNQVVGTKNNECKKLTVKSSGVKKTSVTQSEQSVGDALKAASKQLLLETASRALNRLF